MRKAILGFFILAYAAFVIWAYDRPKPSPPAVEEEPLDQVIAYVYGYVSVQCKISKDYLWCELNKNLEKKLPNFTRRWKED